MFQVTEDINIECSEWSRSWNCICWSTKLPVESPARASGHLSSCLVHSCPLSREMKMSCCNLHIISFVVFFWCVFLLYKRQDHYFQSAAWQIGWMENIFWAWQLKEYCWLHLNDRKRSGLFFIIGMLQENEKRMKVPTSDKTHRRAHPETKNSAPNSSFSWPHAGIHFLKLLHKGCQDSSYIHYTEMLQNMRVQEETKAPSHFVMFNKAPK